MKNILIIEDEKAIQNILRAFLEDTGYSVTLADDGVAGIAAFHKERPHLVLLDLMLPKVDGFTVCEVLRKESSVPIIMLTALDDEDSQIKGFDMLADDYITKPFSMPLVLKRIEAALRHSENEDTISASLQYNGIVLDIDSYEVSVNDVPVSLTAREFEILRFFMEYPGRVFTRDNLLNTIWNYDFVGDEKIVNTHIKNIRKKIGMTCIETIRGVGYRLGKET